jgi:SsrA-binding protein
MGKRESSSELVRNRRAYHDFEILETFEAGMVLKGTEVKSLRAHNASLQEAYVRVVGQELWLIGASISHYKYGNIENHEEKRDRKLLMHKREISRLRAWVQQKGQTLIPLAFYLKKGRIKLKIGRAVGKKQYDKRQALKTREAKRRMEQAVREHRG